MPPAIDPSSLRPLDHLDPGSSLFLAMLVLFSFLGLLAVALMLHTRYRRRARRAQAAFDPHAPLAPGEAVLYGAVEHARGEELAVRVEVTQGGTESESSGSWSHSWTERDRRVRVRPFYLRHASGRRIRVEPHEEVRLVDDMDGCIRVNLAERIRIAELTPGEQIFAHGVLVPSPDPEQRPEGLGYRESAHGLALRPLHGKMLLSSRPLGDPYARRARRHGIAAILFAILFAGCLLGQLPFWLRHFAGSLRTGEIVEKKVVESKDDEGGIVHTYYLWIDLSHRKRVLTESVSQLLYRKLEVGHRVPVLTVGRSLSHAQLGNGATIHLVVILVPLILSLIVWLVYSIAANRPVGWWEAPLEEGGGGRLSESD